MAIVYLDHAASTPLNESAKKVLFQSFETDYANPSAAHSLGKNLAQKIELARNDFLNNIGGAGHQLIFVSSATEANNWIIKQKATAGTLFYSPSDHASLTQLMEKSQCTSINSIKHIDSGLNQGMIDLSQFEQSLDEAVTLVCLTWVNGQNGIILPIQELVQIVKRKSPKAHIHLDGSQGLSKLQLNVNELGVDSAAFSAHKMGGPKGIGALWFKSNCRLDPFLLGGGQELGLRASTQAAPLIFSFTQALQVTSEAQKQEWDRLVLLNDRIREGLSEQIDELELPFSLKNTVPHILCFIVPGISSDILLRHLEQKNIFLSSTSACSSKKKGFNPVFSAMGVSEKDHKFVLRLSMGSATNQSEVDFFLREFAVIVKELSYLRKK